MFLIDNISLFDSDIIDWNNYISQKTTIPIVIRPRYNTSIYIDVSYEIFEKFGSISKSNLEKDHLTIDYNINFSILTEHCLIFNQILDNVLSLKMMSCINDESNNRTNIINPNIIFSTSEHTLDNKEYTRFEYKLSGHLISVMSYDKYINTAKEIFKEYSNVEFQINSIVSTKDDRSRNYLVKNYKFISNKISYILIEIVNIDTIISYGDEILVNPISICNNRDIKISEILKKSTSE